LIPLAPNEPDKLTVLVGEGSTGQEDTPPTDTPGSEPASGVDNSIPSAFILYPLADSTAAGTHVEIFFQGVAADNDEEGQSITAYEWLSDRDGLLSTEPLFTLSSQALSEGQHVISFRAQDNEGNWSNAAQVTIIVENRMRLYIPIVTRPN
jgi:hypothetical protein